MIRHRCAVCGRHINRTDRLFEESDGTLCAACLARLAPALPRHQSAEPGLPGALQPAWGAPPKPTPLGVPQG